MNLKMMCAVASLSVFGSCTLEQGSPGCPIAAPNFLLGVPSHAAKYTLESGTGACAELKGDAIGFEKYMVPGGSTARLAVRAYTLGEMSLHQIDPADPKGAKVNSVGDLTVEPTAGVCSATNLSPATQSFGPGEKEEEVEGSDTPKIVPLPATQVTYQWNDLKFYVAASRPGTVFTANLDFTQDGCNAKYKVIGLWPKVDCSTDADCDPNPDPANGRNSGSGINPEFDVGCDADLHFCTFRSTPAFVTAQ
jgi:hypothetical protein